MAQTIQKNTVQNCRKTKQYFTGTDGVDAVNIFAEARSDTGSEQGSKGSVFR